MVHISMNDVYTEIEAESEEDFNEEDFDKIVLAKKESKQY
jgi:hypothetical protein